MMDMGNDRIGETLESLWTHAGCDPSALDRIEINGNDPILPSIFRVGEVAGATIAAVGAAAAFRSERYLRVAGQTPPSPWGPISGYYSTADGRFVQLHANFPHHNDGLVSLLGCRDDRAAVEQALLKWVAADFENAADERGLCVGSCVPEMSGCPMRKVRP